MQRFESLLLAPTIILGTPAEMSPTNYAPVTANMKLANRKKIPVTPRAAGSGLSGGAVPIYGGILLSIERMNKILEIDTANLMAVLEPGAEML